MPELVVVLIVLLVLAIVVPVGLAIGFAVRRGRIRKAIAGFGWHTEPATWARIAELAQPPFDYGFGRSTSEAIVGHTTDGTPFQAFRYSHTLPRFVSRLAMVALPTPLPPLFISTDAQGHTRIDARAQRIELGPRWDPVLDVAAADPGFARAACTPELLEVLAAWGAELRASGRALDLAIDGPNLVALDAPATDDPAKLRGFVDRLAQVARMLNEVGLSRYAIPRKSPRLGFRGTDWTWAPADPSLLHRFAGVGPVGQGQNPQALEVITGTHRGIGFTVFNARWETTETYHTNNGTGTRTVVHNCPVAALHLPGQVPPLTISHGTQEYAAKVGPLQPTRFPGLDAAFDVFTAHPDFADDLISEQLASWLLQWRPPVMLLGGNLLISFPTGHSPHQAWSSLEFLCAFCDLVPDEVWRRVGGVPPGLTDAIAEPEGLIGEDPR